MTRKLFVLNYWANDAIKAKNIVSAYCDVYLGKIPKNKYLEIPAKITSLLILINPFSCAGRALKNWEYIKEILVHFYLDFEVKETQFAGHAKDMMQNSDLSMYTGVVTVSGDGLIHEVINGLMNRNDKHKPTLGCLQGGTSDGFVSSLLYEADIDICLDNAIYAVGMGNTKKIDLTE